MKELSTTSKKGDIQVLDAEVAVSIPERQVTEKDAMEALRRAGHLEIGDYYLNDLETIGIHARKGTLKVQRGRAMVNQRRLEMVLESAADKLLAVKIKVDKNTKAKEGEILMSPANYATVIRAVSVLASTLTESQQFSVNCEEVYRPPAAVQDPDQVHNSFVPGKPVVPGTTQVYAKEAHFHGQQPPTGTKETV
jgi:hypothetical protein